MPIRWRRISGPDLLLVDEALAVGDLAFQHKCIRHMRQFVQGGGSLLLVSHNVQQVQTVCDRAILLERGQVAHEGDVAHVVSRMLEQRPLADAGQLGDFSANGPVRMGGLSARSLDGDRICTGRPLEVAVRYEADLPTDIIWAFSIWSEDRWTCIGGTANPVPRRLAAGRGTLPRQGAAFPLLAGRYILRATILDASTMYPLAIDGARSCEMPYRCLHRSGSDRRTCRSGQISSYCWTANGMNRKRRGLTENDRGKCWNAA